MSEINPMHKSAVEALLFVSDKPILMDQFRQALPELKPSEIEYLARELQDDYLKRDSGMVIVEIAGGWQMLSNSHVAGYIRDFYKTKTKEKLSKPALEALAIIAYKQPAGRAEVESIRGVNSDGVIAHLLNKGLIEIVGRKEVPGRPFLYGTTKSFLDYFGLKSLEGLPKVEDLPNISVDPSQISPLTEQDMTANVQETAQEQTQEPSGQSRLLSQEESLQSVADNQDQTAA